MNRIPNLTMLKPTTEYAENITKKTDIQAYMSNGMYRGIYDAWSDIASNFFENMEIPMSASRTVDDIISCLEPQKRKMIMRYPDACCIEYRSGSDIVRIKSYANGDMSMTFEPNIPDWADDTPPREHGQIQTTFDISHYGPDSVAAVIAVLFRSHRIHRDRFRRYAYVKF